MSIYAEYLHGFITEEEFRHGVATEGWLYACRTGDCGSCYIAEENNLEDDDSLCQDCEAEE